MCLETPLGPTESLSDSITLDSRKALLTVCLINYESCKGLLFPACDPGYVLLRI